MNPWCWEYQYFHVKVTFNLFIKWIKEAMPKKTHGPNPINFIDEDEFIFIWEYMVLYIIK